MKNEYENDAQSSQDCGFGNLPKTAVKPFPIILLILSYTQKYSLTTIIYQIYCHLTSEY